jgi:UDP-glucose:(heptosyl)LPS alpha-1,3-glucosyltransferase
MQRRTKEAGRDKLNFVMLRFMKFGIFLRRYFPYGGLQRDAIRLAQAARNAGDDPLLVVSEWEGPRPSNIPILTLNSKGGSNHAKEREFAKACGLISRKEGLQTAICFSRVTGTPFHFCGDFCFKTRFLNTKPACLRWLPRYRYYLDAEHSMFGPHSKTHVFFLAQAELNTFQKCYQIEHSRCTLLPPWLKKPKPVAAPDISLRRQLLEPLGLKEDTPFLLFVGSNFHLKGLDRIINALPLTNDSRLVLIVCGKDDPRPYQKSALKNGIQDRVHILGPRDDIQDWMRFAELLVHPARTEPAGMVLLEALTYHLPVICTNVCGYATQVLEAGCRILPQDFSSKDLSASIDEHRLNRHAITGKIRTWLEAEDRFQTASVILNKMRDSISDTKELPCIF